MSDPMPSSGGDTHSMIKDDQWERFFANLADTGCVKLAAQASGVARSTVYEHVDAGEAVEATTEAKAWLKRYKAAQRAAIDNLESETYRRAVEGVEEPLIGRVGKDQDGIVTHVRRYGDSLLMFLPRARDPARFKDRVATEVTGKDGGPVKTENKVVLLPVIDPDAPEG